MWRNVANPIRHTVNKSGRDKWMTAIEARDYGKTGFIDGVIGIDAGKLDPKLAHLVKGAKPAGKKGKKAQVEVIQSKAEE